MECDLDNIIIGGDSLPQLRLLSFCYEKLIDNHPQTSRIIVRVGNDSCMFIINRVIQSLKNTDSERVCLLITSRKLFDCLSRCLNDDKCRRIFLENSGLSEVSIRMCTKQDFIEEKNNGILKRIKKFFSF